MTGPFGIACLLIKIVLLESVLLHNHFGWLLWLETLLILSSFTKMLDILSVMARCLMIHSIYRGARVPQGEWFSEVSLVLDLHECLPCSSWEWLESLCSSHWSFWWSSSGHLTNQLVKHLIMADLHFVNLRKWKGFFLGEGGGGQHLHARTPILSSPSFTILHPK